MVSLFFNKFLLDHSEQEAFSTTLKKLRKRNEAGSLSSLIYLLVMITYHVEDFQSFHFGEIFQCDRKNE